VLADLDADEKDLAMVRRLARVRAEGRTMGEGRFDRSAAAYREAFRDYGLDAEKSSPAEAAAGVSGRRIADELLLGLNDWARARLGAKGKEDSTLKWIWEISIQIDRQALQEAGSIIDGRAHPAGDPNPPLSGVPRESELAVRRRSQRLWLAFAYRVSGNLAALEAVLRYEQGIRPQDYDTAADLAFFLAAEARPSRLEEAAAYWTAAAALRPRDETTYLLAAETLLRLKDYTRVEYAFRKALALNPTNAYGLAGLAVALVEQGRYGDAVAAFEEAIRIEPERPVYHLALATAQLARGKRAEALTVLRKAAQLDPRNLAYHRLLANQPDGLGEKRPPDEREQWRELWADVGEALKKARK
jgi:tetratricopeptide (TPR) repeat protein